MESTLVNSILTSVCCDFGLSGLCPREMPSPAGSELSTSSVTSSGYSSSDEGEKDTTTSQTELLKARDILDLYSNLTSKQYWSYRPAVLPKRDVKVFLSNRSVYHRCEGYTPEVSGVVDCKFCEFPVPVIL
ncbi:uncharacterized protein LOC124164028 [Ischnura elegans]|uniref:uncharacterized protein LOC124164028 n=1 Tax=Ischnura elegans TaxID=197161 RepID=UPI001ED8BBDF|nr:uncharacterized protein LOC124164028 [Ischnura elegans]